ncbi:MAG TPA: DUF3794 domain-containing protein [Firmicutes bacterium]|nr:DUF3794 domain-containing protein [Bacillota bacterium]
MELSTLMILIMLLPAVSIVGVGLLLFLLVRSGRLVWGREKDQRVAAIGLLAVSPGNDTGQNQGHKTEESQTLQMPPQGRCTWFHSRSSCYYTSGSIISGYPSSGYTSASTTYTVDHNLDTGNMKTTPVNPTLDILDAQEDDGVAVSERTGDKADPPPSREDESSSRDQAGSALSCDYHNTATIAGAIRPVETRQGPETGGDGLGRSFTRERGSAKRGVSFIDRQDEAINVINRSGVNRDSDVKGGLDMIDINQIIGQTTTIKVERVIGHGTKQVLLEETKPLAAVKIVDIVATLRNVRSYVKTGKVIVQGTVHKQIYYIGTDDLEHHLAEDIAFSELVEIVPLNPALPATEGMNQQDFSVIENIVWEFDPAIGMLTQKVIVRLDVKVTQTEQLPVALDPYGQWIKTQVVIGHSRKQKFIEERKTLAAIKVTDITARLTNMKLIVKNGKVIVQGTMHKQVFYVGTDDLVHHLAEDLDFSELVEVTPLDPRFPVVEGMNAQDHSVVENLIWEFDPATGQLVQKIIILLDVKVTETEQIPVVLDPYGIQIATDLVIGHGSKQKLLEETKTIAAVKIVDVVAKVVDVVSIVKNGKVIVQGTVQKQIFYVGTDDLVHHLNELLPFSEMVEVTPINPDRPVLEGMDQQDHSFVENVVWEFDPATGTFTEKVIVRIDVKVTEKAQITVAVPPA